MVIGLEETYLRKPHTVNVPLPGEIPVSESEDELDDEENVQVGGLIDFIESLTFTM